MTIRDYRRRRWPAWLAVVATLLLAFAPPLSQLLAARAASAPAGAMAEHHHHAAAPSGGTVAPGLDEDCLRKCGYCDFLAHAPLLENSVPAMPAGVPAQVAPYLPRITEPAAAPRFRLAQPRGPPVIA